MARRKYKKVKKNGKYEFITSKNGKWVRYKNKFILESKIPENVKLKKEYNELIKSYPQIKQRTKKIKDIKKKLYYAKVWILTESNDLSQLKNHHRRGFKSYHLDHIYPIHQSYKDGIPPEIVSDIDNLRFITRKTNMKKGGLVTERSIKLIKKIIKKHK